MVLLVLGSGRPDDSGGRIGSAVWFRVSFLSCIVADGVIDEAHLDHRARATSVPSAMDWLAALVALV